MPVMPTLIPPTAKHMPAHNINLLHTIVTRMEATQQGAQAKPNSDIRNLCIFAILVLTLVFWQSLFANEQYNMYLSKKFVHVVLFLTLCWLA